MIPKYQNEKLLKEELSKGVEESFEFIVKYYYDSLFRYAYSLLKNEAEAKDLVQVCFIKLWEGRKKTTSILNLKSYLYRSIHNGFVDQIRRKRELISIDQIHADMLLSWVEDSSSNEIQEHTKTLNDAIESRPDRCKQTFLLSKKEGLDYNEISIYMGVSVKTVEAQIMKAFRILRSKMNTEK